MDEVDKMKDELERLRLRSSEATAKGGQAYARLLAMAETRNSGQIRRIAQFIASTYNGDAFRFDLFELRGLDVEVSDDMLLCLDALRWANADLYRLIPDGDQRVKAVIELWGRKWPESLGWSAASVSDTYPPPLDDAALGATWDAAWSSLGRPAPAGLQAELMAAWSEPHRHYHDQRHLRECLALWTRWRDHCERPGEVAVALWFHDAIYDPRDGSNELNSAAWAARSLTRFGVGSDTVQRVHDLVMAMPHDAPMLGSSPDARLLVDIDLSILGSPAERFERYDQDVRKEYAWLPGLRYQAARAQVLQSFLDQPQLYHGEAAAALLESRARINLAAALTSTLTRLAQ